MTESQKLISSLAYTGAAFLFLSSFWIEDKQIAVNRRIVSFVALGVGLYFTKTK
jgi:hypothetical protein